VESAWEQEKLEASLSWPTGQGKMPENGDESRLSSARFVGTLLTLRLAARNKTTPQT
jgi:hypothetical protein